MGGTGSGTAFQCMQKTEADVPAENVLRAFETMRRWQKMSDADLFFPTGGMRHFVTGNYNCSKIFHVSL